MTGTHVAKHKVKDTSATNPTAKADQNESRSYMSYFNIHNKVNSPICTSENIFHLDNNLVINSVSEPCQFLLLLSLRLHFLEVIYLYKLHIKMFYLTGKTEVKKRTLASKNKSLKPR